MSSFETRDAGRQVQRHLAGALFASTLVLGLLTACGLSLGSGSTTTELFKSLTVAGDLRVGGQLTMTLQYAQPYPAGVEVACELRVAHLAGTPTPRPTPVDPARVRIPAEVSTPASKVQDLLDTALPVNPATASPDQATPLIGTIQHSFDAPKLPGEYVVKCYTPRDTNNAIVKRITIAPAAG